MCVCFVWYNKWHHTALQFIFSFNKICWRYGYEITGKSISLSTLPNNVPWYYYTTVSHFPMEGHVGGIPDCFAREKSYRALRSMPLNVPFLSPAEASQRGCAAARGLQAWDPAPRGHQWTGNSAGGWEGKEGDKFTTFSLQPEPLPYPSLSTSPLLHTPVDFWLLEEMVRSLPCVGSGENHGGK